MERTPVVAIGPDRDPLYALQPQQLAAYQLTPLGGGTTTHIGYGGAAGGGKSYLARAVAVAVALAWPGSVGIIFRRTAPEVRENHVAPFRAEVPDTIGGERLYSFNAQEGVVQWANGSRTLFGYLERDDHVYRYQGNAYDLMVFEEATHYSWFQVSWLTGNRLRSNVPGSHPFALYPSNPGNRGHYWYKRLFVDRKYNERERPDQFAFVAAKVHDNAVLLDRDPEYVERLEGLDEPYRSWLLKGDFAAGAGLALDLAYDQHVIKPFTIPARWTLFGSFDWGFHHPFSFGIYTADEHGTVLKLDTITGRRLHDAEIAERVLERLRTMDCLEAPPEKRHLAYTVAGHDCWTDRKSIAENLPTTAETFAAFGVPLKQASISRIAGYKNMRAYLRYDRERAVPPRFKLFDTPGNMKAFEQLGQMVNDPDEMEDVLKQDADEYGEGGDDLYDETRYGLASRPITGKEATKPKVDTRNRDLGLEKAVARINEYQRQRRRAV